MNGKKVLSAGLILSLALGVFGCSNIHNIRTNHGTLNSKPDPTLTFLTYNIRVGGGMEDYGKPPHLLSSSKKNLQKLVDAIRSVNPDVIALQEVGGFWQAKFLAKELNYNYVYTSHGNRYFIDWGMAILSKYKIIRSRDHAINHGHEGRDYDPRAGLEAVLDLHGTKVTVVDIHYHLGNYDAQVHSTMRLLKGLQTPIVLLGDFNRKEWDREMQPIYDYMKDTCFEINTDGAKNVRAYGTGFGRIDYIFIDKHSFEVIDVGLIPREHWSASDHVGYFAKLRLGK